jgi:excisionase family DNA binding protein
MPPVGRPKTKARKTPSPELEVLKVGGCSRDVIKEPRDDTTPRRIMTAAEVAEYLQIHRGTVYELAGKGQIPFFRIGIDYRFYTDAIDKWMTDRSREVWKETGYWKHMTPAQRKAEMKRRAKVRAANMIKKSNTETEKR